MKNLIPIILIMVELAYGADFWTSLSIRSPKYGNRTDWEVCIGGESKNTSWEMMEERESGIRYSGSDLQFFYEEFKFQHFLREAVNIEYTKATWSNRLPIKRMKIKTGGSIHSDLVINETKILGVVSLEYKNLRANFEHSSSSLST